MKFLSVKTKVLFCIVTLSIISIGIFAYLSINLYMKDKLAYFYSSISSETKNRADIFSVTLSSQDNLLTSIISGLDSKSKKLSYGQFSFFSSRKDILGIYYVLPKTNEIDVLYTRPDTLVASNSMIASSRVGVNLINPKEGVFLLKKRVPRSEIEVLLVFKNLELSRLIERTENSVGLISNLAIWDKKRQVFSPEKKFNFLNSKINSYPGASGVFQEEIKGTGYFVSFARIQGTDQVFIHLINNKSVYLIQKTFFWQSVIFLFMISSLSLIIGTIGARWLTWHLDKLIIASKEIQDENFGFQVQFKSQDEFGLLSKTFNSMSSKILSQLEELKRYNAELETMVADRTEKLNKLTNIQKGMLNSLGQGFVLIDKDFEISPVYSNIAVEMFDGVPNQLGVKDIVALTGDDQALFKELNDFVFSGVVEFEDMVKLYPPKRTNNLQQKIELHYEQVRNEKEELEYILVIGTDKTAEINSIEKFKSEWNFSQMILKLAKSKFTSNKIISESLDMIEQSIQLSLLKKKDYIIKIQRLVHTIKGGVSYFNGMDGIKEKCHELESFLGPYCEDENNFESADYLMSELVSIREHFHSFIDKYDDILQFKSKKSKKPILESNILDFRNTLAAKMPGLLATFDRNFCFVEISNFFEAYEDIIKEMSVTLNKKVNFKITGQEQSLPEGDWGAVFSQLIHLVRNSLDHGIESPDNRLANGKSEFGNISLRFEVGADSLTIVYADDGEGINLKKLEQKYPEIDSEEKAIKQILQGGVSSKAEVSDYSGRGVGVSALYEEIKRQSGQVTLTNFPNTGVQFVITIPFKNTSTKLKVA